MQRSWIETQAGVGCGSPRCEGGSGHRRWPSGETRGRRQEAGGREAVAARGTGGTEVRAGGAGLAGLGNSIGTSELYDLA